MTTISQRKIKRSRFAAPVRIGAVVSRARHHDCCLPGLRVEPLPSSDQFPSSNVHFLPGHLYDYVRHHIFNGASLSVTFPTFRRHRLAQPTRGSGMSSNSDMKYPVSSFARSNNKPEQTMIERSTVGLDPINEFDEVIPTHRAPLLTIC